MSWARAPIRNSLLTPTSSRNGKAQDWGGLGPGAGRGGYWITAQAVIPHNKNGRNRRGLGPETCEAVTNQPEANREKALISFFATRLTIRSPLKPPALSLLAPA